MESNEKDNHFADNYTRKTVYCDSPFSNSTTYLRRYINKVNKFLLTKLIVNITNICTKTIYIVRFFSSTVYYVFYSFFLL